MCMCVSRSTLVQFKHLVLFCKYRRHKMKLRSRERNLVVLKPLVRKYSFTKYDI